MQRIPTTPIVGVEERRFRVGQDRPSGTADKGISGKVVGEGEKPAPPGTIGLEEARELLADPKLTDQEVDDLKEQVRLMVEIIYEKWLQDQSQNKGVGDYHSIARDHFPAVPLKEQETAKAKPGNP